MTDGDLLTEYARTGAQPAFTQLVNRHRPWVYATALRLVRDPHTAEDVTQAVFVGLASRAASLARHPRLAGWLLMAARNRAAHAIRARDRRSRRERWAATLRWQWASRVSPSGGWDRLSAVLDEQVAALRGADREAILLRYYQAKDLAEVAAALGVTEAAARKRVARAVARLRERLRDRTGLNAPEPGLVPWLARETHPVGDQPAVPDRSLPRPMPRFTVRPWWVAMPAAAAVTVAVVLGRSPAGRPGVASRPTSASASQPAAAPTPSPDSPTTAPSDLTGVVCDPDGRPVAGATVTVAPWDRGGHGETPAPDDWRPTSRTDAAGTFRIRPLPVLAIGTLIASADGFGTSGTGPINVGVGQALRIALARPTALTLTLVAPDGRPAVGVPVRVRAVNRPDPDGVTHALLPTDFRTPLFAQTTDDRGRCTFAALPRGGVVSLSTTDQRYAQFDTFNRPGDGFVRLGHGDVAAATISLHRAASIRGRVTFGPTHEPIGGLQVIADPSHGGAGQTQPVYTAADGTFAFPQLRGGLFNVSLLAEGGAWRDRNLSRDWTAYAALDVRAVPGQQVTGCDLELIHGRLLTGHVLDDGGDPVADVRVRPAADPLTDAETTLPVWTAAPAVTDATGTFTLRLPPGDARLMVWNPLPAGVRTTDHADARATIPEDGDVPDVVLHVSRER